MPVPLTPQQALNRAAALCGRSEQCVHDIREKLLRWGLEADEADAIVNRLMKERFIDDERYARAYAHDKFLYNGWGPVKIRLMLRQKGISPEAIASALETVTSDQTEATLIKLLQSKWRTVQNREPRLARAAMLRFAASRGFDSEMCYRCVDQVMRDNEHD